MGRNRRFGALGAWLFVAASAGASDDPPPLTAPAAPEASSGTPATREEPPKTGPSSVLAVPGLTLPRQRPVRRAVPTESAPAADTGPPLAGPRGMFEAPASRPRASRGADPVGPPGRVTRPLTLESVPSSALDDPLPPPTPSAAQRPTGRGPAEPATSRPLPGLFGRMFVPGGSPAARREAGAERNITVVPRSDPAADAALKRRLETQIKESFGDRVRNVEVRVVGRDVTIRARATRLWQRRAIRRSLEALPGLGSHRTAVEVD